MKKLTAALCAVLLVFCMFVPGAAAAGPALGATRAYCIIDADTGLVLAQQNMNEELHPASITKVMTLGLACEKAQGNWEDTKLTVSHEDVYSLAGTDSSHIALLEGEEVPLTDALYATQMASANNGANLLAEYFGGGTIADGVEKMNAKVKELGLAHTHFSNPHGISDEDHYTSCYDMAQILRWALEQPGFEQVFTRNEMYTMDPTNIQPVTRYFSQQDKMRIGSSRYHITSVKGSKLGYTNTARYSYACLAEQNGVRLICVTMQSELSTTRADIGIAMGAMGSDAAIEAADIVLMDDDPLKIAKAIKISRKCLRIVYENTYFAIGIKLICLVLGAVGIANMWLAIFADVGVMVIAVLNAIRALFVHKL